MAQTFRDRIEATLTRYRMIAQGHSVIVAVSGGADSVAMLHALHSLSDYSRYGWRLTAAHLNHGFRGAESDDDAEYVRDLCASLGMPCVIEKQDVPGRKRRLKISSQEAARETRHDFLKRTASKIGAECIALGHTRDDRVETVLLNLFRGTGSDGLAGFSACAPPLIRPLYEISREETRAYCAEYNLQPHEDSSNANLNYRRNRLRTELLPNLTAYYNERIDDAVLRMSDLVSADNEALDEWAARALGEAAYNRETGRIHLDIAVLNAYPPAIRRRVVRRAIQEMRGSLADIGFACIEDAIGHARAEPLRPPLNTLLPLTSDGVQVGLRCERGNLLVERVPPLSEAVPWQQDLSVPGRIDLPGLDGIVSTERLDGNTLNARLAEHDSHGNPGRACDWMATFRWQDVKPPFLVRSWRAGDRLKRRAGSVVITQKLQDVFSDRKLPRSERSQVPVLVDDSGNGRILSVAGFYNAWDDMSVTGCGPADACVLVRFQRAEY